MKGVFMTEEVRKRVDAYRPLCLSPGEWARWGPSVLEAVFTVSPRTVDEASRTLGLLARFAADAERWGWEPPLAQHLSIRTIDRHIAAFTNGGAQRTRRSVLVSIGRVVNPIERWPMAEKRIGKSARKPPYSEVELRSLHEAAKHQEPRSERRLFQVVLALGLGGGHDGRSIHSITPERIERQSASIVRLDRIGTRPGMRVSGTHGRWLNYWAANTEAGHPIIGPVGTYNSRVHNLFGDDSTTPLKVARVRTTFVVHLLKQRTLSICEIVQLAGLSSATSLDVYRTFLAAPDLCDTEAAFASLDPVYEGDI